MGFKPPPAILQRIMRMRSVKYTDDGGVKLWGIPAGFFMMYAEVYLQRLMEKQLGAKKASSLLYGYGSLQSGQGFKMISKRFGYAKTIPDKVNLLKFNTGQAEVAGRGKYKWLKIDFDKEIFISKGTSTTAKEYKRFFGTQKQPIDHYMRGGANAYVELTTGKKCFTAETMCIATGDKYCEFVTRPIEKWDKKDPLFKKQAIDNVPDIKKLGAKIEPYLVLYD